MKLLEPGETLDGFVVKANLHSGGMAHIYQVQYANGAPDPGFRMAMKVPRMATGDGAENIVGFEVEAQIRQALSGPHVPRFVAAGDLGLANLCGEFGREAPHEHFRDIVEQGGKGDFVDIEIVPGDGPVPRPLRRAARAVDDFQDAQKGLRVGSELLLDLRQIVEIAEERHDSDHHDGPLDGRDVGGLARAPVGFDVGKNP